MHTAGVSKRVCLRVCMGAHARVWASSCDMVTVLGLLLVTLVVDTTLSPVAAQDTAHVTQQRNLCLDVGGKCLRRNQSCHGLTLLSRLCGARGGTCCTPSGFEIFLKNFRKPLKRLPLRNACEKTSIKCRKRGGSCISHGSPCNTYAANKFCPGSSCTCCFGDHTACSPTPACKGGFCFRGNNKKVCRGGKIIPSGCAGRRCSCCIPKGSQDHCSCGKSNGERIVGGHVLTPHKFPWLVGLLAHPFKKYYCGGTIISPEFVLTAGHCLHDQSSRKIFSPSMVKVRVADHNQFSHKDDVKGITQLVDVKEIIPHEFFILFRPYHDIGLLRLATRLDLESYPQVRAVCLPSNAALTYEGLMGVGSGWGVKMENSSQVEDVPREVTVPILGPTCKNTQFGDVTFTSNMLCAGLDEGGKDTCLGDSGGPFTVEQKNRHVIVGITSFGMGCGRSESPGVYTRITGYLTWINSKDQDTCTDT